jgi:hypothetical protein
LRGKKTLFTMTFSQCGLSVPPTSMPCGNAMIDAPGENLMDRQAAHRFTPSAWKSLRLSHNHLDNCSAVTHIPTRSIITDLIGQRAKIIQAWDKANL